MTKSCLILDSRAPPWWCSCICMGIRSGIFYGTLERQIKSSLNLRGGGLLSSWVADSISARNSYRNGYGSKCGCGGGCECCCNCNSALKWQWHWCQLPVPNWLGRVIAYNVCINQFRFGDATGAGHWLFLWAYVCLWLRSSRSGCSVHHWQDTF